MWRGDPGCGGCYTPNELMGPRMGCLGVLEVYDTGEMVHFTTYYGS